MITELETGACIIACLCTEPGLIKPYKALHLPVSYNMDWDSNPLLRALQEQLKIHQEEMQVDFLHQDMRGMGKWRKELLSAFEF